MVLVVAKKSRTFFPVSHIQQMSRWEEAQPGSQPKLANRNTPYHRHNAQNINGGWPGGRNSFFAVNSALFFL